MEIQKTVAKHGVNVAMETIFVVYDDTDMYTESVLFTKLEQERINYVSINHFPGTTMFECLELINPFPKKMLIVLSINYIENEKLKFLTESIMFENFSRAEFQNITTLVISGSISRKNGLLFLAKTSIIHLNDLQGLDKLITEIHRYIPPFCHVLAKGNVTNTLSLHGLCFRHLEAEIFGILILGKSNVLQIDLEEYANFCGQHSQLHTDEVLERCGVLNDANIVVVINDDVDKYLKMRQEVAKLCASVINTSKIHVTTFWNVACSVSGKYGTREERFLSDMYHKVWVSLANKCTKEAETPRFIEFQEADKRMKSFPDEWKANDSLPINNFVKAGLFYVGPRDSGRCFHCGCVITNLKLIHNAVDRHAHQYPGCKHIEGMISGDKAKNTCYNSSVEKQQYALEVRRKYDSTDVRRETFCRYQYENGEENDKIQDMSEHFDRLAEAGFYYMGLGKMFLVQCFKCCVRLFEDIPPDQDIWTIHALLSPSCSHIVNNRGKCFIQTLLASKEHALFSQTTVITFLKTSSDDKKNTRTHKYAFRPW